MSQSDLFSDNTDNTSSDLRQTFQLANVSLDYHHAFLPREESDPLIKTLMDELPWSQPSIHIAGKQIPIPRMQVWFGDKAYAYTYSGVRFNATPWHPSVLSIKHRIESATGERFNSGLCNLYRDGKDSVAWHSDDEPELGASPVIASFSLGETRPFHLRQKANHQEKFKIDLTHNSLLVMGPGTQELWEHQIPKSTKALGPRINITFRKIV